MKNATLRNSNINVSLSQGLKQKQSLLAATIEYFHLVQTAFIALGIGLSVDIIVVATLIQSGVDNSYIRFHKRILEALKSLLGVAYDLLRSLVVFIQNNAILFIVLVTLVALLLALLTVIPYIYAVGYRVRYLPITVEDFKNVGCNSQQDAIMYLLMYQWFVLHGKWRSFKYTGFQNYEMLANLRELPVISESNNLDPHLAAIFKSPTALLGNKPLDAPSLYARTYEQLEGFLSPTITKKLAVYYTQETSKLKL